MFDPDACWLLADILADNHARARSFGMGSALRLPFPCAVKTGTSTDYRDNWTVGYTPEYTVGVWVGNFDNSAMRGVSGVSGAAPIFRDVMSWLVAQEPSRWYPMPPGIGEREVDPLTGLPRPSHFAGQRPVVVEKFRRALLPDPPDASQYDPMGRVRLPVEFRAWLEGPDNWLGSQAIADLAESGQVTWRITSPLPGTPVLLDPDLPAGGKLLPLRVSPAAPGLIWSSPTLNIERERAHLVPGRHEIFVRDPATGQEAVTWVLVKLL